MAANPPTDGQGAPGTHTEAEVDPWKINIPDHAQRADSPAFVAARAFADKIMSTLKDPYPFGPGPWQMHHGGSLWTYDGQGWFLLLNTLGSEWSAQFCADPTKMELIRLNAVRHYAGFPQTIPQMHSMGYTDAEHILQTPITDAQTLSVWVDSIFNSCVPLAAPVHVGVIAASEPLGGAHHYPRPIADIQFFKHDDFVLWVTDAEGQPAAVTPASPRGSGDGRVEVAYATPNTKLAADHHAAHLAGRRLILAADDPMARQAFAKQGS